MSNVDTIETPVAPVETIVDAAAKALDDRKSKLAFAKQVLKSRNAGTSDEDFAEALVTARVHLAYGPDASVETYAKDFQMSASKVSQYGTALTQLQASKAPVTEDTFADWFKLTATGGSATVRKGLIATLTDEENADLSQEAKANIIRAQREAFISDRPVKEAGAPRNITLDGLYSFLERLSAQDWDATDRETIETALFQAGGDIADGNVYLRPTPDPVDEETVAA